MAVVHPESSVTYLVLGIDSHICTSLELHLAFSCDRNAAEGEITEGTVLGREHIVLRLISLHLPGQVWLELREVLEVEFLKTDDVCILIRYKVKDRILVRHCKSSDVIGHYLKSRIRRNILLI